MAFRAEDCLDAAAIASADNDNALALAVLVLGKTTIAAVFLVVRGLT